MGLSSKIPVQEPARRHLLRMRYGVTACMENGSLHVPASGDTTGARSPRPKLVPALHTLNWCPNVDAPRWHPPAQVVSAVDAHSKKRSFFEQAPPCSITDVSMSMYSNVREIDASARARVAQETTP
jgi:hypothetical protein